MLFFKFNILEDLCFLHVFYVKKLRNQYFYGSRRSSSLLIVQVLYMIIVN